MSVEIRESTSRKFLTKLREKSPTSISGGLKNRCAVAPFLLIIVEIYDILELSEVMQMNKAYKFRIYPTLEQKIMFAKKFGCVRFIYNHLLTDKLDNKETKTPAAYKWSMSGWQRLIL